MLTPESTVYLQLPSDNTQRVLEPVTVIESDGGRFTVSCEQRDLPVEAGMILIVYYDRGREFLQQAAQVTAVMDETDELVVGIELVGEPASAECRQNYRVSTVAGDLFGSIKGKRFKLMDVSATGFSLTADATWNKGEIVEATLDFDGQTCTGKATVQSLKTTPDGQTRYGFHCTEKGPLLKGLGAISMAVQRQQLKRRSGAA